MCSGRCSIPKRASVRSRFSARSEAAHTRRLGICAIACASMKDPEFKQLMGVVEVDETYIGGKQANRHATVRGKYHGGGAAHTGKTTVVSAIARKGNVVCQIIEDTSAQTL